jgi:hypothetical protein
MLNWCEMSAPDWARAMADERLREKDCVPSALYPPTPRDEDGSRDDLLYWHSAVERFCDATANGWVHKNDWAFWRKVFESIPCVSVHFHVQLPIALRVRRTRREHARVEAAKRGQLDLAKAIPSGPPGARGQWVHFGSKWRWKDYDSRVALDRAVQPSV